MTPAPPTRARISELRTLYENELFDRVLPFWKRHSVDVKNGGFFNCLDRDGAVYDTHKHVWMQSRQVWMFSKLYRTVEQRPEWLALAKLGADFLRQHAIRADRRVYFELTADGRPVHLQRKIFSECYYVMALAEYSRASGDASCMKEAKEVFERVWEWAFDWTQVGRPVFDGAPNAHMLAVPMILLNLIEELTAGEANPYDREVETCIDRMLLHVDRQRQQVLEHVAPDGSRLAGSMGRVINPGHAIEGGWFLQHWAQRLQRVDLAETARDIVRWSYRAGWDDAHGGLFYFLDADGFSPTQLDWSMKLWWPHCEALYATALTYRHTHDPQDWALFEQVHAYTFARFPDVAYGEWYGYLDRQGRPTHRFKGGPFKGCFHVPRTLLFVRNLLGRLEALMEA